MHIKNNLIIFAMFLLIMPLVLSEVQSLNEVEQGECITLKQKYGNSTYSNITTITYPNKTEAIVNYIMSGSNGIWQYNFCNTKQLGLYEYCTRTDVDGVNTDVCVGFESTPNGKPLENDGTLSIGILYFFVIIGLGFLIFGYLNMKNKSIWITYAGLFMMLIGFAFLYYDLHLANLYATTIGINSGAGTVTTGAFVMVAKFLKLAPYIFAGIVAFAIVKLLNEAIKGRKNGDGWDNGNY